MNGRFCLINFIAKSRFFILAASAVFLLVFGFFIFKAEAQFSQFKPGDKNYAAALAAVAADEAKEDINIEERVKSDEDLNPEDFGFESVGLLPTNPFYFLKNARRGVTSFFTFNPVRKAERNLQFAAEKLLEAKTLVEREGTDSEVIMGALENFQNELDKVKNRVENVADSVEGEEAEELSKKVMDSMMKYGKSLTKLEKDIPPDIFDKIKDTKDKNAETFGTVFELIEPEKVSEKLAEVMDEQKGSEFKQFKNLEILKDIKDKVPENGKNAIKIAEENAFLKLQNELERFDAAKKAIFEDFVRETGGNELRHLEIINELEARPLSENLRGAIAKVKEGVLSKTGDRLDKLSVEQQNKFFEPLAEGELQDVRVIKELERSVRSELLPSITGVKNQATQNFIRKFDDAGGGQQEILEGVERFHDAKSIAILEEIKNLIPDDKKGAFEEIKKKAANEIKRDIDRARNKDQREVIFNSLAGDHPEEAEAMGKFKAEMDKSLRNIFSGVQEAIMRGIQARVETINDKDRLIRYEEEFNKRENVFKTAAPQNFRTINNFFDDRRVVFESPDRALQKIDEAMKYVNDLRDLANSLPLDLAYGESGFDPAIREVQRMLQLAEKKIELAKTILSYNDVGRAFGEANAAAQVARDGIRFAQEFKSGKKRVETQNTTFVPFFEGQPATQTAVRQGGGFMIYSPYEFSQYCFFVQGFMKGPFTCALRDGRVFNIEGKGFPFEIPPEFVPRKIDTTTTTPNQPICPAIFTPSYDFCPNGKVIYDKDERGCDRSPRCDPFKDQQTQLRLHPTDKSICGGLAGYQCVYGYKCQISDTGISDAFGKCVPETDYNTCQAYFTGYVYDSAKRACRQESVSGCSDPFTFHSQSDCERANGIGLKICPALPTVTDCPAGQKKVVSFSSQECGTYYACVEEKPALEVSFPYTFSNGFVAKDYASAKSQCLLYPPGSGGGIAAECEAKFGIIYGNIPTPVPEPTVSNWIKKIWYFSDGLQESSYILNRTDAEYQNYIAPIQAKCLTIPKNRFVWKPNAGDDRADNWQNFGIPDCSGTETTTSSCSAPGNCYDAAKCASSGWYWYNGGCWSSPQSGTTGGSGCSQSLIALLGAGCHYMYSDSSGKTVYCDGPMTKSAKEGDTTTTSGCQSASTSTTGRCVYYTQATCDADSVCKWTADRGCGSKAICNDGIDNDNDGKIDYPADTGCYDAFDNDEAGPTTATVCPSGQYWNGTACMTTSTTDCVTGQYWDTVSNSCKTLTIAPACSDGKDNDADGHIDYPADTGCTGADDNDETASVPTVTIPAAPTNLTHTLSGSSAIPINWTDNATNETSYEIEKKSSGETSWSAAGSAGIAYGSGTYTVTASPSTSYEYRVKACNSAGCSEPSNIVTIPVFGCSSPANCGNSTDCASAGYYWCSNVNSCYSSSSSCPTTTTTACNSNGVCDSGESSGSCPVDCGSGGGGGTSSACSTPRTCFDSSICTSSGWYWYSGECWGAPQSSTSCPSGQYWDGTACVTSTSGGGGGGSGCGSWMSQSDCTSHSGCTWNSTGNYCYYQ